MLAFEINGHHGMMGLGGDGAPVAPTPAATAQPSVGARIRTIGNRMTKYGLVSAAVTGGLSTILFASAFSAARTERVWTPALILGGASALNMLIVAVVGRALASGAVSDVTIQLPNPATPVPVQVGVMAPPGAPGLPSASGSSMTVTPSGY